MARTKTERAAGYDMTAVQEATAKRDEIAHARQLVINELESLVDGKHNSAMLEAAAAAVLRGGEIDTAALVDRRTELRQREQVLARAQQLAEADAKQKRAEFQCCAADAYRPTDRAAAGKVGVAMQALADALDAFHDGREAFMRDTDGCCDVALLGFWPELPHPGALDEYARALRHRATLCEFFAAGN